MPAPPAHSGPCKRSGDGAEHNDDVTALGRYRGLCGICRPIVVAEGRAARAARGETEKPKAARKEPVEVDPDLRPAQKPPTLENVCQELVTHGRRLDVALDAKRDAHLEALAALGAFKRHLTLIGRVAQGKLNTVTQKTATEGDR